MKQIIVVLCGKKQTGKSTSYKFIEKISGDKYTIEKLSFASKLKNLTADVFGVDYNMLIGTDEEKDSPTYLKWNDVSLHIKNDFCGSIFKVPENEYMSHRELLQLVGTNLFRAVRQNIWVECLQRSIEKSTADIIIIDDARFPNELEALKNSGGTLVKLYRNTYSPNSANHSSETALDHLPDDYYDFVIFDRNQRTMEQLEDSWEIIMSVLLG